MQKAYDIYVTGIVQGVGFRPFVYRLASQLGIKGFVKNLGGNEVLIHIECSEEQLKLFLQEMLKRAPERSRIDSYSITESHFFGLEKFEIRESESTRSSYSMVPPDIGICDKCLREIEDPKSRFFKYPFHSCVNCGPRFSMMYNPPYDRANTSMKDFPLCNQCLREYGDPSNERRFHAQGISCPSCGPRLKLYDSELRAVSCEDPLSQSHYLLNNGKIVAIKGIGGYHLAALANEDSVVEKLRARKRRWTKPFALMALDIETVKSFAYVDKEEEQMLLSPERPIVLLKKKEGSFISELVAPGLDRVGVMLPYTALHFLLLSGVEKKVLIMTSANISGEPMCTELSCLRDKLLGVFDYVLDHNREIVNRVDDSVVRKSGGSFVFLRRSRGFAPRWVNIGIKTKTPIVSLGGFLNNTASIAFDGKVVLTQHIGDLDSPESVDFMFNAVNRLIAWYGLIGSKVIVSIDKHPGYPQRRFIQRKLKVRAEKVLEVQHHYAHALQALESLPIEEIGSYVAIAIDGTGYGDDGNVWGGEVLKIYSDKYERVGHISYFPLLGGDLSAKEAVYPLSGMLYRATSISESMEIMKKLSLNDKKFDLEKAEKILFMLESAKVPIIETSSLGRVLDAFSCILGYGCVSEYDGELPMKMEAVSKKHASIKDAPERLISENENTKIVNVSALLNFVLERLEKDGREKMAYSIQWLLGYALGEIASKHHSGNTNFVFVSGGAAVNDIIIEGIKASLNEKGLKPLLPKLTPPGDGGLSFGQAVAAVLKELDS